MASLSSLLLLLLSLFPRQSASMHATAKESHAVHAGIDWDTENKLPPWMTSITEGSQQAVAVLLGQSLPPDGSAPQVLVDRAEMAKKLLDEGRVVKIIVSGADPAGVGHTEASMTAKVLMDEGVPSEAIIQESQAITTAENAWFILRWIPKNTGKVVIITSDFHMARATYIFEEVFAYFYRMMEDTYRDDPRWKSSTRKYPRLQIVQAPTASFCGSDASLSKDHDPKADIDFYSLAKRARDELRFLASGEVSSSLYGEPLSKIMYIWPIQINVTQDPLNTQTYQKAFSQAMTAAKALCKCVAPPEVKGPSLPYPLKLPIPEETHSEDWHEVCPEGGSVMS